eukprot:m.19876 g.19876  ORF g.19876 m.19876 type:complete len:523 (+) comp6704_c0_seq1:289-1857(+)
MDIEELGEQQPAKRSRSDCLSTNMDDSDFGSDDFDDDNQSDFSSAGEMDCGDTHLEDVCTITCIKEEEGLNLLVMKMVNQLVEVTGLSEDNAIASLFAFNWNVESVIAATLDGPEQVAKKAGYTLEEGDSKVANDAECCVCMEGKEDGVELISPNNCDHVFCKDCLHTYLGTKVDSGASLVTCLERDCSATIKHSLVLSNLDSSLVSRYWKLVYEAVVMGNKHLVWCPTPECVTVLSADSVTSKPGTVECNSCKNKFCFDCGVEHAPASCENMKSFQKKKEAEGGNYAWLSTNTKECPKCAAFIEKNGGCNWIKCFKCKYEFCWLCGRHMLHSEVDVAGGSHKCNVFKEGEETELKSMQEGREKVKQQDERRKFAHYHSRHQAHEDSAKLEEQLLARHNKQDQGIKGEASKQLFETQKEGLMQLRSARRTLCSSYIFGLYQVWEKGTSLKEVFEDLQHLLESRTEALSRAIETSLVPTDVRQPDEKFLKTNREAVRGHCDAVRTNQRNLVAATTTDANQYKA